MRPSRNLIRTAATTVLATVLFGAGPALGAAPKTFFDLLDRAWAVGELRLSAALEYRDGRLLAFPAHLTDLVHARLGKPRTLMIVHERNPADSEPFLKEGDQFLAAVGVLPDHSYWRDNLPVTKRHEILGGRRYVFKSSDPAAMETAKAIAGAYTATLALGMPERARRQAGVMVDALLSGVPVLAEDGLRALLRSPRLARDLDGASVARLAAFLSDDSADPAVRGRLALAAGEQGADSFVTVLEKLAGRDDAVAAAALAGLDHLERARPTAGLLSLLEADALELRIYAAETLGARAGADQAAMSAAVDLLAPQVEVESRLAAARGLGTSASPRAIDSLAEALSRGDAVTRTAAMGLARIGGPRVHGLLKEAITDGPGEAMVASVMAMVSLRDECADCLVFLAEQHDSHKESAVREMIAIMLELPKKHEH